MERSSCALRLCIGFPEARQGRVSWSRETDCDCVASCLALSLGARRLLASSVSPFVE